MTLNVAMSLLPHDFLSTSVHSEMLIRISAEFKMYEVENDPMDKS